jgi:hypothetical protein
MDGVALQWKGLEQFAMLCEERDLSDGIAMLCDRMDWAICDGMDVAACNSQRRGRICLQFAKEWTLCDVTVDLLGICGVRDLGCLQYNDWCCLHFEM